MKPIANKIAKKQAGYSLVELSVALAIVAVILVGGLMGTRQILLTNNVNNQLKDSALVIAKITRQFQNSLDTRGATNQNLIPLSVWPVDRFTNSTNASGIFTGTVNGVIANTKEYITPNGEKIGSLEVNNGFLYTFTNVPAAACPDLISGLDNMAYALYAGKTIGTAPTGVIPGSLTAVKAADTARFAADKLAAGCSSLHGTVDITAVIRL
jgi:prepilin-type N-terminal cleavage/methylation domain-containing protein